MDISRYVSGRRPAAVLVAGALIAAATLAAGCGGEPIAGDVAGNEPPRVWLSSGPPEGSRSGYIVHLYWGGWDPDGRVAYFEYTITDNESGIFDPADTTGHDKWRRVQAFDSTFVFSADVLEDSSTTDAVTSFARSHTFFIRAVDEQGLASPAPAYRSFTAWTLSPTITVTLPKRIGSDGAQVPPISTFKWTATDYVNDPNQPIEPDSVRWILVPVQGNDWDSAIEYFHRRP